MQTRIYIQVAKSRNGIKVSASRSQKNSAITDSGWRKKVYPTIQFPLDVEIPDEMFDLAKKELVQKIKLSENNVQINVELPDFPSDTAE